jgi:exonuclease 3'-5' domain-containing protein 1
MCASLTGIDVPTVILDTTAAIADLIDGLLQLIRDPPSLFLDLEGVNLSREGSISILTLLVQPVNPQRRAYLIDIHTLGSAAFTTKGAKGLSLQNILESPTIPKVFFDVRNDSDALYAHYNIALQGVVDIQLMENASRTGSMEFLKGLAKCINSNNFITHAEREGFKAQKVKGELLFNPDKGGSYEVFNARPLSKDIMAYCVGDVQHLPSLYDFLSSCGKLSQTSWKEKVAAETKNRVLESQMPSYQPHSSKKVLGPWPDEQTSIGKFWNQSQDLDDLFFNEYVDDSDDEFSDFGEGGPQDIEDWTRCPWQGPPS